MSEAKSLILNQSQVDQKITRMAYQIYENNLSEKEIVFAGIWDKGYQFASILKERVDSVSSINSTLVKVNLDKNSPTQTEILIDLPVDQLKNKVIVLVDDVLNSGRTLAYSLKPFLDIKIKKLETAVLVNRDHTSFPLSATYNGHSLSTTIQEHVEVVIDGENLEVYLY
ncbi:MAG: phosphoribosyltransferase family protein [Cyclobacteriaceae bacterium]